MEYRTTVGLEVHAELKTRTKMFCDSRNDPDEKTPNVNICPVCMAHPGTLPVINREAVKHVLKIGLAVGGKLADFTEFDRKNYFYPDIPKGYQISQYQYPLVAGGELCGVKLTRIHLEEDTARSSHPPDRQAGENGGYSLVDFNRAGIPLMELVTEPVVHSAAEASAFARELQLLLRTLGASDANMEKGEMRVEANVSVSTTDVPGTKVEVKNLNSFRAVERAIVYETARQSKLLERGEKVVQETRGWDESKQATFSQRLKEESHDYRYFPDPDLPKLQLSEIPELNVEHLRREMPELPWEKRARFMREFGVKEESARIFTENIALGVFFEAAARRLGSVRGYALAENYITTDLVGLAAASEGGFGKVAPESFSELIIMLQKQAISSRAAKDILAIMYHEGGMPEDIARSRGLLQQSDAGELAAIAKLVIQRHATVVAEFRAGKTAALQFLVGQIMKESKGSANPALAREALEKLLSG